jgi:hypothetical protein
LAASASAVRLSRVGISTIEPTVSHGSDATVSRA